MKITRLRRVQVIKLILGFVALIVFAVAGFTFSNSQKLKEQQSVQAQQEVLNHTQTLNEIDLAVKQLKMNNQVNHDTTIKYLQCIVQGLINSTPQTAQASFNACLTVSGIQTQ